MHRRNCPSNQPRQKTKYGRFEKAVGLLLQLSVDKAAMADYFSLVVVGDGCSYPGEPVSGEVRHDRDVRHPRRTPKNGSVKKYNHMTKSASKIPGNLCGDVLGMIDL